MGFYNGQQQVRTVTRYFTGTTTLRKGQVLSYQHDASKTDADLKLRLGVAVASIVAGNLKLFAGVVDERSAGKVGPCFVMLNVPLAGEVVEVEVDGTTDVAQGDLLEPDTTKAALIKATAGAGDNLFTALEAQAADSKVVILATKN